MRKVVGDRRSDGFLQQIERGAGRDVRGEVVGLAREASRHADVEIAEAFVAAHARHVADLSPTRRGGRDDVDRCGRHHVDQHRGANPPASGHVLGARADRRRQDIDVHRVVVAAGLAANARRDVAGRVRAAQALGNSLGILGLEEAFDFRRIGGKLEHDREVCAALEAHGLLEPQGKISAFSSREDRVFARVHRHLGAERLDRKG